MHPQDDALFEQAIFFVRDNAAEITERELLRQAQAAIADEVPTEHRRRRFWRMALPFAAGVAVTAACWLVTILI